MSHCPQPLIVPPPIVLSNFNWLHRFSLRVHYNVCQPGNVVRSCLVPLLPFLARFNNFLASFVSSPQLSISLQSLLLALPDEPCLQVRCKPMCAWEFGCYDARKTISAELDIPSHRPRGVTAFILDPASNHCGANSRRTCLVWANHAHVCVESIVAVAEARQDGKEDSEWPKLLAGICDVSSRWNLRNPAQFVLWIELTLAEELVWRLSGNFHCVVHDVSS